MDGLRPRLLRLSSVPMWPLDTGYPGHSTPAAAKEVGTQPGQALGTLPYSCPRVLPLESQFHPVKWEGLLPMKRAGHLIRGDGFQGP